MTFLLAPKLFNDGIMLEELIVRFLCEPEKRKELMETQIGKVAQEIFGNLKSLEKDPIAHLKKTIALLKDPKASCTVKIGLASNAVLAVAIPFNIPFLMGVGLIGSTAAHLIHLEEAKHLDVLKEMNRELKTMNQQMAESQVRLQTEVDQLRQSLITLRQENQALQQSNHRLKENIRDLEKNITALQSHGSLLDTLSRSFDASLERLERGIQLIQSQDREMIERVASFDAIHDSIKEMTSLLRQFFAANHQHQKVIEQQQIEIQKQLSDLTDLTQNSQKQIEAIKYFPDLTLMAQQMELALKGIMEYQKQLVGAEKELASIQQSALLQKNALKRKQSRFQKNQAELLKVHLKKNKTLARFILAQRNYVPIDPFSSANT